MRNLTKLSVAIACSILLFACSNKEDSTPVPEHFNQGLDEGINQGIAQNFTNDEGIDTHEDVLAFENFETGAVQIYTEEDRYKNNVKVVQTEPLHGSYCGEHSWPEGLNGPTCRYPLPEKAHEGERQAYFVRMYMKFDESFHPYYNATPPATGDYPGVGVKGFGITCEKDMSEPCDGTNWYNAQIQFVGWGPSAKDQANNKYLWVGHLYSYNPAPNQAIAEVGEEVKVTSDHRFSAYASPFEYIQYNKWYCYEIGMYLNTPGKADGEARFWINGVLQSRTVNIRYRDLEDLKPMHVHLNLHRTTEKFPHIMKRYVDNIVIARKYIGPANGI